MRYMGFVSYRVEYVRSQEKMCFEIHFFQNYESSCGFQTCLNDVTSNDWSTCTHTLLHVHSARSKVYNVHACPLHSCNFTVKLKNTVVNPSIVGVQVQCMIILM